MEDNKKNFVDHIWLFFVSMKVAVFFIIILALVSIIGTLIPQNEPPEFYGKFYSLFWYNLILTAGLNNLYNSLIYRILLAIIGINITICSIEHTANRIKTKKIIMPFDFYKNFMNFTLSSTELPDKILNYLKKKGFQVNYEKDNDSNIHMYCEHGKLKPWGPFMVHMSILIIFAGAIYGGIAGYKDYVTLLEFKDQNIYREKNDTFQVRLKDFYLDIDENHRIKQYFSELEVFEGNMKVMEKTISVNDPLEYKGVVFYQANWGMVGLDVTAMSPDGTEEHYFLPLDESGNLTMGSNFFILPNDWVVKIGNFYPDVFVEGNNVTSLSYLPGNPAITLQVCKDFMGNRQEGADPLWIDMGLLKKGDSKDFETYKFTFNMVIEYTGLQIKKDPGVPLVYFGCFLMMAGLIITFYTSRKIIRIFLKFSDENTYIYAGFSGKYEEKDQILLEHMKEV